MAKVYTISQEQLEKMKNDIPANIEGYRNGTYSLDGIEKIELRSISIDDDLNEKMISVINGKNYFESARILHENLKISPLLATNEGLWTYLTHGPLQGFTHKVWNFEQLTENQSQEKYVEQHWFVENQSQITRNALASLWWGIEISKIEDNNEEDKYKLSKILFENYTLRVVSLAQILRMRNVLRGILEWINDNIKDGGLENRGKFIAKYLNQLAGVKQLSILTHCEIYALIDKVSDVIMRIENRADVERLTVAEIIYNIRNNVG